MNCICSSCKKENLRCFYVFVDFINLSQIWEKIELFENNQKYYHYEDDEYLFNTIFRSIHDINSLSLFDLDNIICQECYTIMDIIK
jgi:hypothetical protein